MRRNFSAIFDFTGSPWLANKVTRLPYQVCIVNTPLLTHFRMPEWLKHSRYICLPSVDSAQYFRSGLQASYCHSTLHWSVTCGNELLPTKCYRNIQTFPLMKEKHSSCAASFLSLSALRCSTTKPANRLLSSPLKLSSEIQEHPNNTLKPKPPYNRSPHHTPKHWQITFLDKGLKEGGL